MPVVIEYDPKAYASLEAAVLAALEAGAGRVVLDLDRLGSLDNEGVRGLIALLRRSRQIGGELSLRSNRPEVRRTLEVTALNRIFTMEDTQAA